MNKKLPQLALNALKKSNAYHLIIIKNQDTIQIKKIGDLDNVFKYNPFTDRPLEFNTRLCHKDDKNKNEEITNFINQNEEKNLSTIIRLSYDNNTWDWIFCNYIILDSLTELKEAVYFASYFNLSKTRNFHKSSFQENSERWLSNQNIDIDKLTKREQSILKLTAQGKSYTEIAVELFIQPETVNRHRKNIMKKLNVHKIAQLTCYALEAGII